MSQSYSRQQRRKQKVAHCHVLIKETAIAIANEAYQEVMVSNFQYSWWKKQFPEHTDPNRMQEIWVGRNWGRFVEVARATLGRMLAYPHPEALKEQIMEALCLDATLVRGRRNPATILAEVPAPK